jgi:putative transposase
MKSRNLTQLEPIDTRLKSDRTWELDCGRLDVAGKPSILTATDVATRTLVASHIVAELTPAMLTGFLSKACQELGVPERLVVDNGRDFMSREFRELADSLGAPVEIVGGLGTRRAPTPRS